MTLAVESFGRRLYAERKSDRGVYADHTLIILSPHANGEIVWTFHPGPPLPAPRLDAGGAHGFRGGETVSVRAALSAGVTVLKHVLK